MDRADRRGGCSDASGNPVDLSQPRVDAGWRHFAQRFVQPVACLGVATETAGGSSDVQGPRAMGPVGHHAASRSPAAQRHRAPGTEYPHAAPRPR